MRKSVAIGAATIFAVCAVALVLVVRAAPSPPEDNTAELQSMFDQVKPGGVVNLDPMTYHHSGVLRVRVPDVRIEGNGATLQATNDATSAVQILADNVTVSNLNLGAPLAGKRYDAPDQHKLVIEGNGVTVDDVTITGSAATGVFIYGAGGFTLNRVTVRNSRADGIHMTNGAHNGQVNDAVTESTGDDGVAVVSYASDTGPCHDIVVNSPVVKGTTWGRGLTVVGGNDIAYRNISVSGSDTAGVYIADEGDPWFTRSTNRVQVTGGTVTGTNTNTKSIYGAVLVYSGNVGQSVNDVTISGLTVASTPASAQRNVGIVVDKGSVSNIKLDGIALQNSTLPPLLIPDNIPAGSYTASGWTLDGNPIDVR